MEFDEEQIKEDVERIYEEEYADCDIPLEDVYNGVIHSIKRRCKAYQKWKTLEEIGISKEEHMDFVISGAIASHINSAKVMRLIGSNWSGLDV